MQLKIPLSIATSVVLSTLNAQAEDYVSVQFMQYDENNDRTSISAPSLEINKDFGTDYTLNAQVVLDSVSGASPTFYDSSSGASAYSRGPVDDDNVAYGNVDYDEQRAAGALLLTTRFANRDELKTGVNYSSESDFYSYEGSAEYLHYLDANKNNSVSMGISYQYNEVLIKDCRYNGACDTQSGASEKKDNNVVSIEAGITQIVDQRSYAKISLFSIVEDGYLSSPYHNIVRNYATEQETVIVSDSRPDTRTAYGTSLKYVKAFGDDLSAHFGYRYYTDDWDIDSHTLSTELFYEVGDYVLNGGLRYYMQSEADFYSAANNAFTDEKYASSDERLSDFNSMNYKLQVDYKVSDILDINIGLSYYDQSTGLSATYLMTGFKYKF